MSSAWKHLNPSSSSTTLLITKAEDYILFGNKETFKKKKKSKFSYKYTKQHIFTLGKAVI